MSDASYLDPTPQDSESVLLSSLMHLEREEVQALLREKVRQDNLQAVQHLIETYNEQFGLSEMRYDPFE
jgi:hypothetical protein